MTKKAKWGAQATARLLAVQALYEWEIAGTELDALLRDFPAHWQKGLEYDQPEYDAELFARLLTGAIEQNAMLDETLNAQLQADWNLARLNGSVRALLRIAAWEVLFGEARLAPLVSQYTDMAHAFVEEAEAGRVNALLDALAKKQKQKNA